MSNEGFTKRDQSLFIYLFGFLNVIEVIHPAIDSYQQNSSSCSKWILKCWQS